MTQPNKLHTPYVPGIECPYNTGVAGLINNIESNRDTILRGVMAADARSANNLVRLGTESARLAEDTLVEQVVAVESEAQNLNQGDQLPALAPLTEFHATQAVLAKGAELVVEGNGQIEELNLAFDGMVAAGHVLIDLYNGLNHSVPGVTPDCLPPRVADTLVMPIQ